MKRSTRVSAAIGLVVSAFLVAALAGRDLLWRPYFQRDETARDLHVDWVGANSVFWLDNSTLVFSGSLQREGHHNIYIWRLGEEPKVYMPETWPAPRTLWGDNYLCAQDGKIFYSVAPKKYPTPHWTRQWSTTVMIGPPGQEKPTEFSFGSNIFGKNPSSVLFQNLIGKRCESEVDPQMVGHWWVYSRHSDAILDFGGRPNDINELEPLDIPLRLIRTRDRHTVELSSIDHRWARFMCAESLSWEDAFVVWRCENSNADLLDVHSYSIWKIKTDGTVSRTTMHTGDLWGVELVPSRAGYFAVADSTQTMTKENCAGLPSEAGLYSIDDQGEMHQLVRGFFHAMAVSPDGCLSAFATTSHLARGDHLVVFDLCKAAKGNGWPF